MQLTTRNRAFLDRIPATRKKSVCRWCWKRCNDLTLLLTVTVGDDDLI